MAEFCLRENWNSKKFHAKNWEISFIVHIFGILTKILHIFFKRIFMSVLPICDILYENFLSKIWVKYLEFLCFFLGGGWWGEGGGSTIIFFNSPFLSLCSKTVKLLQAMKLNWPKEWKKKKKKTTRYYSYFADMKVISLEHKACMDYNSIVYLSTGLMTGYLSDKLKIKLWMGKSTKEYLIRLSVTRVVGVCDIKGALNL